MFSTQTSWITAWGQQEVTVILGSHYYKFDKYVNNCYTFFKSDGLSTENIDNFKSEKYIYYLVIFMV